MFKRALLIGILATLTACDCVDRARVGRERADRLYQAAMDDYRAGRIDAAIDGFGAVVRKDPANASARFQLACLLQDARGDYLGAFCGYREYVSQQPDSEKTKMAKDRLAKCELELARQLAEKHGLSDKGGFVRENEALKRDLHAAEMRAATSEKEVESLRARVTALGAERERLLAIVKGVTPGGEDVAAARPSVREAKELLEEAEDDTDRIRMSADAAALRAETDDQLAATGSSLLPANTGVVARVARKKEEPKREVRQIPETHVVREGDTLYAISKRYYGRLSAWKKIRDLNKTLISSDNRLHVGDKLVLPRE